MKVVRGLPVVNGPKLRELRLNRGLTLRGLSALTGVTPRGILRIEQNVGPAQQGTIMKLCIGLGVSPADLYVDDED